MPQENHYTRAQTFVVASLRSLFDGEELTESERERAERIIETQQPRIDSSEDFHAVSKFYRDEDGHRRALEKLYYSFKAFRESGGELNNWYFLYMAEICEVNRLFGDEEEPESALIRGTSFLEHDLEERVTISNHRTNYDPEQDYVSFGNLVNWAADDGVITASQQKLYHFVREVRNMFAHHTWLDRQRDYSLLVLAGRVVIYLIDAHVQDRMRTLEMAELTGFIDDIEPEEYLSTIRDEHGWTYREEGNCWDN